MILPEPAAAARAEYCLVEILSASLVDAAIPCTSKLSEHTQLDHVTKIPQPSDTSTYLEPGVVKLSVFITTTNHNNQLLRKLFLLYSGSWKRGDKTRQTDKRVHSLHCDWRV